MKGLNINRSKIEDVLNENLSGKYEITKVKKSDILVVYKFVATGENIASLNIHYVNDGSTTLQYKTGANPDLSLQIATLIKESCSVEVFKSNSFCLKAIRKEDFDILIEFLSEENTIESDQTDKKNHRVVKVKGHQGDNITLNHYSNGSFQAQGKPKLLFNDTIFLLSELMPFKEIISSQLEFYESNLTTADYIGELGIRLPIASQYLNDKIKSIISPSLLANKISIKFEDYSIFAFPALRGLEGVIKQLFFEKGIVISNKGGFKDYISIGNRITLTDLAKENVKCQKTQNAICEMFDFFNAHRNSVFHVDGTVSTTRVLNFQEATQIINTTFDLIEKSFSSIKK